jgi:uncharacterized protein (TIGR00297 family)
MQLLSGFLIAVLIAFGAYRLRSLDRSGAYAAVVVGTLIFGLGGWQWAVLLLAFFITSSALSRAFRRRKQGLDEKFSKGSQRDAGQVFGNGALAALFAALHFFTPDSAWVWVAFAGTLAAVNADTWATELGVLNPSAPRMITDLGKDVEKGTSGAISPVGTLASLAGAALIGVCAVLFSPQPVAWTLGIAVTAAGLLGSLFDSLLGATVQAIYYCPACQKETERHPLHTCGTATTLLRGWPWLDNDLVNLGCGLSGVLAALLLVGMIQ